MTMTINKDTFPRFTKRLKKSLQKNGVDLPLNKVQEVAAQSLGKESFFELNILFNKESIPTDFIDDTVLDPKNSNNSTNIYIPNLKEYDWFIEEAGLQIGASMGRIGQNIGQEHVKQAVIKSLQHILSKNSRITMTLREANNLVECYGGDDETEITISRFKDDNKLYGWYTDYPEEGRMLLEDDNHFPSEMKKLTMDLKLPYYQNTILTTLSAWILEELDQAQRLVDHANNIRTDQFSLDNSYGFYTTKHQNFSNELITDIISGHEYNLTVMLALLDYIKGFVNTDILTSLDFHFLKKSSPFIWELFTTFDKPEQSQQVKTVMEQYKNERKFGNMRQPQYDL